jgi:lipoprotein-anchoring transpeptidase ErfK/SrfK
MSALSLAVTAKLGSCLVRLSLILAIAACLIALPASANVVAHIDHATQRMTVVVDGAPIYSWPVSTGRSGYETPAGSYYVQRMERMWYSRKYDMTPMPYSLFFEGGLAIHGTSAIRQLGRPASHGCVRLSPRNAQTLFELVRQHGGAQIVVTAGRPATYSRLGTH